MEGLKDGKQGHRNRPLSSHAADPPWLLQTHSGAGGSTPCSDSQATKQGPGMRRGFQVLLSLTGWTSITGAYLEPHTGLNARINFGSGIFCIAVSKTAPFHPYYLSWEICNTPETAIYQATIFYTSTSSISFERESPLNLYFFYSPPSSRKCFCLSQSLFSPNNKINTITIH